MQEQVPHRVKIAVYFILASLVLSIIKNLLYATMTSIQIWSDPLNMVDMTYTAVIGLLGYYIYNVKNWARILYLLIILPGILASPIIVIRLLKYPLIAVVAVLIFLFQWIALFLIFRKQSNSQN